MNWIFAAGMHVMGFIHRTDFRLWKARTLDWLAWHLRKFINMVKTWLAVSMVAAILLAVTGYLHLTIPAEAIALGVNFCEPNKGLKSVSVGRLWHNDRYYFKCRNDAQFPSVEFYFEPKEKVAGVVMAQEVLK